MDSYQWGTMRDSAVWPLITIKTIKYRYEKIVTELSENTGKLYR